MNKLGYIRNSCDKPPYFQNTLHLFNLFSAGTTLDVSMNLMKVDPRTEKSKNNFNDRRLTT